MPPCLGEGRGRACGCLDRAGALPKHVHLATCPRGIEASRGTLKRDHEARQRGESNVPEQPPFGGNGPGCSADRYGESVSLLLPAVRVIPPVVNGGYCWQWVTVVYFALSLLPPPDEQEGRSLDGSRNCRHHGRRRDTQTLLHDSPPNNVSVLSQNQELLSSLLASLGYRPVGMYYPTP
jgi:hypothetical protein